MFGEITIDEAKEAMAVKNRAVLAEKEKKVRPELHEVRQFSRIIHWLYRNDTHLQAENFSKRSTINPV